METFYFTITFKKRFFGTKTEEKIEIKLPSKHAVSTYASYVYGCYNKVKNILVTDKNDNFVLLYAEN